MAKRMEKLAAAAVGLAAASAAGMAVKKHAGGRKAAPDAVPSSYRKIGRAHV